jgi:hypothetical protein
LAVDLCQWATACLRALEGIAGAKAGGIYKGRKASIDPAKVKKMKADGVGASAIAKAPKDWSGFCLSGASRMNSPLRDAGRPSRDLRQRPGSGLLHCHRLFAAWLRYRPRNDVRLGSLPPIISEEGTAHERSSRHWHKEYRRAPARKIRAQGA